MTRFPRFATTGPLAAAAALACAAALLLGGCATPKAAAVPAVGSDGWLAQGACHRVESATGDAATKQPTVLTITGAGSDRTLTFADLDRLPQVECSVDDRQAEGRQVSFTGPLLSDVLKTYGPASVQTMHASALNDYAVDIPFSDVRDYPVLLATRLEGQRMSVSHYGPIRVVYPTTGFDLDPTVYDPRWIWQLKSLDLA